MRAVLVGVVVAGIAFAVGLSGLPSVAVSSAVDWLDDTGAIDDRVVDVIEEGW